VNPEVFGTYTYPNFANRSKISTVFTILKEYRQTAKNLLQYFWSIFYRGGKLPYRKSLNVKHIHSNLSERYKYVCLWQVYGIFDGYISNLQYQFANMLLDGEGYEWGALEDFVADEYMIIEKY